MLFGVSMIELLSEVIHTRDDLDSLHLPLLEETISCAIAGETLVTNLPLYDFASRLLALG
jgi:hypothetical protein